MRRRDIIRGLAAAGVLSAPFGLAEAGAAGRSQRVRALTVANAYGNAPSWIKPLANSVNDAELFARAVRSLPRRDKHATEAINLSRDELDRAVDAFVSELGNDDVVLFHYAGHGFQVDGSNWLITEDIKEASILDILLKLRGEGDRTLVAFLDCCRTNLFRDPADQDASAEGREPADGSGRDPTAPVSEADWELFERMQKGVTSNLAQFELTKPYCLVVFATDPNNTAADYVDKEVDTNSPFTRSLAKRLRQRVLLTELPHLISRDVVDLTRRRAEREKQQAAPGDPLGTVRPIQVPWSQQSVINEIYLAGPPRQLGPFLIH